MTCDRVLVQQHFLPTQLALVEGHLDEGWLVTELLLVLGDRKVVLGGGVASQSFYRHLLVADTTLHDARIVVVVRINITFIMRHVDW